MSVFQSVFGRDIADGAVEPDRVVMVDEFAGNRFGLVQVQRRLLTDAISLERTVPAFDLAVAFGIVRRGSHVG